jgi:dipeptidyl aminopeptidase/acylaminoacyl peptidase
MRAFFEKIAPANNVAKITKPLFIVQGRNDPRVPYTEAEQMLAAIKKQGVPAWFMMAKDEGHGFRKQDNVTAYQQAVVLFFQQHLLP